MVDGLSAGVANAGSLSRIHDGHKVSSRRSWSRHHQAALESLDEPRASIAVDEQRLRYQGLSEREWLSPFGKLVIRRRSYRGDGPGALGGCPLDDACGMRDGFMMPDVEEIKSHSDPGRSRRDP